MDYYFDDFTEENYSILLKRLIRMEYEFSEFDYEKIASKRRIVLWRHDIDLSINRAYKLAEIEKQLGVRSTYYIYLHSIFYNIFEPDQYDIIKKIVDIGHMIGLHFDPRFYIRSGQTVDEAEMEKYAEKEKNLLENYLGIKIKSVSLHNPAGVLDIQQDYFAGMVNAYADIIHKECVYCSDSNGYWRFERLQDVIEKKHQKLHILTHPAWWTPHEMAPYERIMRCLDGRRENAAKLYRDLLAQFGRHNVGYPESAEAAHLEQGGKK